MLQSPVNSVVLCEVVKLLIEKGAVVNKQHKNGKTALMEAANNGHSQIVQMLIDAGADVRIQNKFKWNALMEASHKGHTEVVKQLINADINVNVNQNLLVKYFK